jgi:hypothetical protein
MQRLHRWARPYRLDHRGYRANLSGKLQSGSLTLTEQQQSFMATVFQEVLEPSGLADLLSLPRDAFFLSIQKGAEWPRIGPSSYNAMIAHALEMPVLKLRWNARVPPRSTAIPSAEGSGPTPTITFSVRLPTHVNPVSFAMRPSLPCRKLFAAINRAYFWEPEEYHLFSPTMDLIRGGDTLQQHHVEDGDVLTATLV